MRAAFEPRIESCFLPSVKLVDAYIRCPRGAGRWSWTEALINPWRISRDHATARLQKVVEDALVQTFFHFSYGHRLVLTPRLQVHLSVEVERRLGLPEGMARISLACAVMEDLHAMLSQGTSLAIDGALVRSTSEGLLIEPCPELQSRPVWMPELMRRLRQQEQVAA